MQACGLAQHDERVMELNAQFAFVASARGLGCRHERPVHGDLNLGHAGRVNVFETTWFSIYCSDSTPSTR